MMMLHFKAQLQVTKQTQTTIFGTTIKKELFLYVPLNTNYYTVFIQNKAKQLKNNNNNNMLFFKNFGGNIFHV